MKKRFTLILFTLIIMLTLCIIASASDNLEWTVSEDGKSLIVGENAYELYEGYFSPTDSFVPEKSLVLNTKSYDYGYLKKADNNDDIIILSDYYYEDLGYVYVSKNGKSILDEFTKGSYLSYKLVNESFDKYTIASNQWIGNLDGGVIETVDVRSLANCEITYIVGCDSTGTLGHTVGAIYKKGDSYLFVNYDKLPNNYFDSTGRFSYRQGEVKAYKLNIAQVSDMNSYNSSLVPFEIVYKSEDIPSSSQHGKGFYIAIFVIVTAIIGFIIPLIPLIIGAIRILKGKTKNPKRWYLMFAGCGLWILLAICILLTLI